VQDPKNGSFHKLLNEMGELVDAELARRGHPPIMKVERILTTIKPQKFAAIDAGLITPVREKHLDMLISEAGDRCQRTDRRLIAGYGGPG
jgi:hypothetical protein